MLSAGETNQNQNQNYIGGTGAQPPVNMAGFQSSFSGPTMQPPLISGKVTLDNDTGANLLGWQLGLAAGDSILNTTGRIIESFLQAGILEQQYGVMNTYYETQGKIAEQQASVLNKQEDTKVAAITAQKEMLADNNKTQKELTRTASQTTVAVASIQEKGRNERARIYASSKAFTIGPADKYGYGNPQRSLLT